MQFNSSEAVQYLDELRQRLISILISVAVIFIIAFAFSRQLFSLIAKPLLKNLPANGSMIATDITSPFVVPIKLALFTAVILSLPIIFYHLWKFISPALYKKEKKLIFGMTFISLLLFFLGMTFCYNFIFPLLFKLFISLVPNDVLIMTDISHYLKFFTNLLITFGTIFQIPIIISFLIKTNAVDLQWLKEKRSIFIIISLIISMILTPPDVIAMLLLAIPICLLYEIGIIIGKFIK